MCLNCNWSIIYFVVVEVYVWYEMLCVSVGVVNFGGVFLIVVVMVFYVFFGNDLELVVKCYFLIIWFYNVYVWDYFLCISVWIVNFGWVKEFCGFLIFSNV